MRFSDGFLEEIRQRLPISQVVGEHVLWDKRKSQPGRGDFWANCPFHGEKTPSFHADDRKGIYHCFGCGVTGDHFRFLTEKAGMSFPEAVEKLAGMAGLPMPARDERDEQRQEARRTLYDVMEVATQYFEAALSHNIGARARGYLNERGVSPQSQTRFRIGYAPDSSNGLKEHLAANGVSAQDMVDAGLVVVREDSPLPYDRFRNRVMFPISDFRGRIIAFGGRALSADVPAKYLNSPETDLFKKRFTLYNGKDAREAARADQPVIVVEGYLDVIAAVSAGFEGTVAPLGTALTEEHLAMLWRMTAAPVLCFDGDEPGQRAAERTIDVIMPLLQPGQTVKIATLPEGLDPDDIIRQQGREAFAFFQAVRQHRYEGRGRDGYRNGGQWQRSRQPTPRLVVSDTLRNSRLMRSSAASVISDREALILVALVNHPGLVERRLEELADLDLPSPMARNILTALLELLSRDHDISADDLRASLGLRGFADVLTRMEEAVARQGVWQAGRDVAEPDAEIGLRHVLALHYKSVELNRALKAAQQALDVEWTEEAFERLRDIQNQITTVDGTEALIEGFGSLSGRATRGF
jgi:DNA primase